MGNAINSVTYTGIRLSALWKVNDDLGRAAHAELSEHECAGRVLSDRPIGPEGLTFNSNGRAAVGVRRCRPCPSTLFNSVLTTRTSSRIPSLTVDGKVGDLKLVYAGGYLVRNIEQQQDYTNYSRGVFGYLLPVRGLLIEVGRSRRQCFSPARTMAGNRKEHAPKPRAALRARRTIGASAASAACTGKNSRSTTIPTGPTRRFPPAHRPDNDNCFNNVQPLAGRDGERSRSAQRQHRILRRHDAHHHPKSGVRFVRRRYHSEDLDLHRGHPLLPFRRIGARRRRGQLLLQELRADHLLRTLHLGNQRQRKAGRVTNNPGSAPYGTNFNAADLNNSNYHGFRSRANLSWHVTEDMLLYYTWSQGFRPGGFNRGIKTTQTDARASISTTLRPATVPTR